MTRLALQSITVELDHRTILHDITMDVPAGSCSVVIGPNGSGKSTLLRAIAGVVRCSGRILLDDDEAFAHVTRKRRAHVIAYAPQEPLLPPNMTVAEFVLLARSPHLGYFGTFSSDDHDIADDAIDQLDLTAFRTRRLGTLSGGERRRSALAQVIAQQCPIVLLDEPTTALDIGHQQTVLELVDRLRRQNGLTVVMTMHDLTLAAQYANALVLLQNGRVVATGEPSAVLDPAVLASHYGVTVEVVDSNGTLGILPVRPAQQG